VPDPAKAVTDLPARQLPRPFPHDLHIAQVAQAAKYAPSGVFHGFPGWVGINGAKSIGHGPAAPQCYAQVVNRVGLETLLGEFGFSRTRSIQYRNPSSGRELEERGTWRLGGVFV